MIQVWGCDDVLSLHVFSSCFDVFIESGAFLDNLEVQKARNYKKLEFVNAYKIVT
jgi:hypothetical protein